MKTALVTGAYKGLGLEWCRQLGKQGYQVILTARDLDTATEAAFLLKNEGLTIYPKALDVSREDQLQDLALWIDETFGAIDLIINNAGVNPKDYKDKSRMAKAFYLKDLDAEELLSVITVNSIAPLLVVKHLHQLLLKSSRPLVVNISSWLGSVSALTFGGHYGYVGSKNLLNVFNKSMALELKTDGIICVNVNPGWVQTDMGGSKAQFTTEQAVSNLLENIVGRVTVDDTGKFFNYDGTEHPW